MSTIHRFHMCDAKGGIADKTLEVNLNGFGAFTINTKNPDLEWIGILLMDVLLFLLEVSGKHPHYFFFCRDVVTHQRGSSFICRCSCRFQGFPLQLQ